jgi:hypothetical protein
MADYNAAADSALRQITDAGRLLLITRKTEGAHDPVEGTTESSEVLSWSLPCVILPATQKNMAGLDNGRLEQGSLVLSKTRLVMAAAKGSPRDPEALDRMAFDGSDWLVLGCIPLSPAGVTILYKMGVMKI